MSEQYLNPFISQSLASSRSWGTMSGGGGGTSYPEGLCGDVNGVNTDVTLDTTDQKIGDGCYSYNGSSSKTVLGSASDWDFLSSATSNIWTISFWMKYEDSISPGHTIMSTTDGSTQNYGMFIDVLSGGNIRLVQVNGTSATWTGVLSDSDWHFYVFTWNNGTTELWFDGSSQGTKSQTATSSDVQNPLTLAVNNDEYWIDCLFDDMAVWDGTAISSSVISDLYNSGSGSAVSTLADKENIVAYYNFDSTTVTHGTQISQTSTNATVTVFGDSNESLYGYLVDNTSSVLYDEEINNIKIWLSRTGSTGSNDCYVRLFRGGSFVHTFGQASPSSISSSTTAYTFGSGGDFDGGNGGVTMQSGDRVVFSWDRNPPNDPGDFMSVSYYGDSSANIFDSGNSPATLSLSATGSSWTDYNPASSGANPYRDLTFEVNVDTVGLLNQACP